MATPVIMPQLGLTMTEGTLVRWLKPDGAVVEKGEPLLEVLTDKANLEVEAPATGRLQILAPEGATLPILEVIGQVLEPGEAPPDGGHPARQEAAQQEAAEADRPHLRISPAARRVARELGIEAERLRGIPGTGPGGRIMQDDVRKLATGQLQPTQVIPLTGVRGLVAERMARSAREAPQFHVSADLVVDQLVALREELLPLMESEYQLRLSYTDLLAKVVARVLTEFQLLNSYVSDREISVQPQVNLGVAVGSERGLVVPVIRDAANRSLPEVVAELKRLAGGARQGTLLPDDLARGTFTLSNLGMFGVSSFTAILNPPQAGILAVGGFRDELRLAGRGIEARTVATFTLTCDHRAVDGLVAARFLARLKALVEGSEVREVCVVERKGE